MSLPGDLPADVRDPITEAVLGREQSWGMSGDGERAVVETAFGHFACYQHVADKSAKEGGMFEGVNVGLLETAEQAKSWLEYEPGVIPGLVA